MNAPETSRPGLLDMLLAYLELVRLPNLFTAMADVTMGFLFVCGLPLPPGTGCWLGLLIAASTVFYAGGAVLNDYFDEAIDREERPERPIPSGRVSPTAARWFGTELLVLGAALAGTAAFLSGSVGPAAVAILLVACIVLYDAWLKRTPLGPLAMGGCRLLNVLLGMSVLSGPWGPEHWLVATGIGTYVAGVTWLARSEARRSNRLQLAWGTLVMLCGIGLLAALGLRSQELPELAKIGTNWYLLMGMLAVLIGWRCVRAVAEPSPFVVQTAVKQAILSLVMLDAVACFSMRGMMGAMVVLVFLVPAIVFGQLIRAT